MKAISKMSLPVLAVLVGVGMIVAAASIALWSASQTIHVVQPTITVTVDGTPVDNNGVIGVLYLYVGGTHDSVFRVANTGAAPITVTLSCEVTGGHATVTIAEVSTQTILADGHYDYTVTVTGVSAGDCSVTYSVTQIA
jgi:hypothetical protein